MFGKIKKLYELKKKADSMKKEMEAIHLTVEERGIQVKIRGDQHIEEVTVDGKRDDRLKDAVNRAVKESQKKVAKKMQGNLGDLGIPGLS